jgi:thiamine biosynthesis protein ThiS
LYVLNKPLLRFFLFAEVDMQIVLNGDEVETEDGCTIEALLLQLKISRELVAVELNADIVLKADYEKQLLSDGDKIEIVHFVGGGSPV